MANCINLSVRRKDELFFRRTEIHSQSEDECSDDEYSQLKNQINQLKIILFEISELTDYANLTRAQNFSFMINLGLFCFFSMKIT